MTGVRLTPKERRGLRAGIIIAIVSSLAGAAANDSPVVTFIKYMSLSVVAIILATAVLVRIRSRRKD